MKDINPFKIAGEVISGAGSLEAGRYARKVAQRNAENALRDGVAEAARLRDTARLAIGRQLAGLGASGFTPDSGSALDALRESAVESELEIMSTRRQARSRAQAFEIGGEIDYAAGYNAFSSSLVSAAGSVVEGIQSAGARGDALAKGQTS